MMGKTISNGEGTSTTREWAPNIGNHLNGGWLWWLYLWAMGLTNNNLIGVSWYSAGAHGRKMMFVFHLRATSHTRLKTHDQFILRSLIGQNVESVQVHFTLEGEGLKILREFHGWKVSGDHTPLRFVTTCNNGEFNGRIFMHLSIFFPILFVDIKLLWHIFSTLYLFVFI